ncbi:MAG TPA: hypothetical protein VI299_15100 [Polyangiales bacterium]
MGLLVASLVALHWHSLARAEACAQELRTLQELQRRIREEVLAGHTTEALAWASKQNLGTPAGYDFDNDVSCQKWAFEVAAAHRASCSFTRAREQLQGTRTDQPRAADALRAALERLSEASTVSFRCKDKKELRLICQPASDDHEDAWCARDVEQDDKLEFPRHAWCRLVDRDGVELSSVSEPTEPTCREELEAQRRAQRLYVRAQRRGSVATTGTGIAALAAIAVPVSFLPTGMVALLQRLGALDEGSGKRLRHNSRFARRRVLPLIGVTALSVSSLSSRYWWAGVLTAGCGVTADVMLAQHWRHPDPTRRAIGITTATVGAAAGLLLNLDTIGYSDTGSRFALMPTLSVGVAQAELGLAGRF